MLQLQQADLQAAAQERAEESVIENMKIKACSCCWAVRLSAGVSRLPMSLQKRSD